MKSLLVRLSIAAAGACALSSLPAFADVTATVDLNHTSAAFSVKHLTISTVSGVIPLKDARVSLGSGNIPTSAEAVFDITKVDTKVEKRDNDLRSERFFDVTKYPDMTFKSTKITPGEGTTFTMTGDLTMHGVTKPVTLSGKFEGSVKDNQGKTHLGYNAYTTVDRTQWGIGSAFPPYVVGNDITINLQVEAIQ